MRAVRIETPLAPDLEPLQGGPRIEPTAALPLAEPGWLAAEEGPAWPPPNQMGEPGGWPALPDPLAAEEAWPGMAEGL